MHLKKIITVLIVLLAVNIVTTTLGGDKSKLTVFNRTDYYLHFIIDGTEYLFVPPERSITHEMDAKPSVVVKAFYAPGQGVKGMVSDTVGIPFQSALTGCSCEDNSLGECSYTPPTGGSGTYDITTENIPTEYID
jgi:hypothetical protein